MSPVTSRNPQANSILERVHQTIDNIIHTYKVQYMVLDDESPWDRILASTMFALPCNGTYRNVVYPSTISIWTRFNIEHTSQSKIGTQLRNVNKTWWIREIRKKIAIKKNTSIPKGTKSYFKMRGKLNSTKMHIWVRNNGTVRACKGKITDTFNICNITPYRRINTLPLWGSMTCMSVYSCRISWI